MARIRSAVPEADVRYFDTEDELEREIELADIVAGEISAGRACPRDAAEMGPELGAPDEPLLYPEMIASPVVLTSVAGNGAIPMAEHAVMLMLMLARDTRRWLRNQDERKWERWYHPELTGQTCGIIGLGYSGQDLALKLKAFHMRVIGIRRDAAARPRTWTRSSRASACTTCWRSQISWWSRRRARPRRAGCWGRPSSAR